MTSPFNFFVARFGSTTGPASPLPVGAFGSEGAVAMGRGERPLGEPRKKRWKNRRKNGKSIGKPLGKWEFHRKT